MRRLFVNLLRIGFVLLAGGLLYAHVRLIYSGNGNVLFWSNPGNVSIVINSDGSDDIHDSSHFTAIRNAIDAWNDVPGSVGQLKENTNPGEQASKNWSSDSRHLVLFDEDNSTGYFPGSSGIVAVTPLTFYLSGQIIDADILFNGKNFQFTTSGQPGRFDVQDVAAHELGHLLGLDHTGCAGGTMYPYVDTSVILHRSLSQDEVRGMQHMYPSGSLSKLKGTVRRASNGSVVKGAWVGARDADGRMVASALANSSGRFNLTGLPAGTYSVYATPLEGPVSSWNLTSGHTVQTDFQATTLGQGSLSAGGSTEMGDLYVDADASVLLGSVSDDYPLRTIIGASTSLTVRGTGLVSGSTLEVSDPDVTLSNISWNIASVTFTAAVPQGELPGHLDLTVTDPGGSRSILCGGLELTPPDPLITLVQPIQADANGGATITVNGQDFRPGLRVVVGDRIYEEGTDVVLTGSTSLRFQLESTVPGLHDVVVIDETGVEGRRVDALQATAMPILDSIFPAAGSADGGTVINLLGDNFVPGSTVSIAGVVQPNTSVQGLGRIRVVTEPGAPGGPYVISIQSPAGDIASGVFVYSADPDPVVSSVDPGSGPAEGGETVLVHGSNFTPSSQVWFGAGAYSGSGGAQASQVTFLDSETLQVVTPQKPSSSTTVMVRQGDPEQAHVLTAGYEFKGSLQQESGGGCASVVPMGPDRWRDVLSGAGWMGVLFLALLIRRRQRVPVSA